MAGRCVVNDDVASEIGKQMTNTEIEALALVNEVQADWNYQLGSLAFKRDRNVFSEALCRAIEQHEAFRQEVSDIVYRALTSIAKGCAADAAGDLSRFIIPAPKPDPLVEALDAMKDGRAGPTTESYAACLRAKLDALGYEIREKNDG